MSKTNVRAEIVKMIRLHISSERLDTAISCQDKERGDAIAHVIKDAVRASYIVTFSGIPHVYSSGDGIYVPFDFHEFRTAIDELMRKCGIPDGNYGKSGKLVAECWSEVMCHKEDVDNSIFVMKNGVFDTMDCKLHPYNSCYLTNTKVNYSYDEESVAVNWSRFMSEVLPDKENQMLLQEFVAASLIDRKSVKFENALILLGSGSNGKSVVFEIVSSLLGDESVSNFSIGDLIGPKREQNIACCNGKRMNYCSEIRTTEIKDTTADAFKSLVSGEPTMARSLYKEPFKATCIPIIMANANRLPKLSDASYSLQRRIVILPFEVSIPEEKQNKELSASLKSELPGIFNWVVSGFKRLRANKYRLSIPDVIKAIIEDYIKDNNPTLRWLDEKRYFSRWRPHLKSECVWKSWSSMFAEYDAWCKTNSESRITKHQFVEILGGLGYDRRRQVAGMGYMVYEAVSEEDIRSAMLDVDIAGNKLEHVEFLQSKAIEDGKTTVIGSDNLERLLGLQEGVIYKYMDGGFLSGTYTVMSNGNLKFDVMMVQAALSSAGYYEDVIAGKKLGYSVASTMRGMRHRFNTQMEKMGLPFRKFKDMGKKIKMNRDLFIIVPDDWEYSKRAAVEMMSSRNNNSTNT